MGIKVILSNEITKKNSTTDSNGSFQFSNVYPGIYKIIPSADYYTFAEESKQVSCQVGWKGTALCDQISLKLLGFTATGKAEEDLLQAHFNLYSDKNEPQCQELADPK